MHIFFFYGSGDHLYLHSFPTRRSSDLIKPETESRLTELASKSGRATDDLVEDALAGYLTEVAEVREMLDGRYDDIKSGRVKPIDGEAFFDGLRQREDELLKQRNPK